jgi:acyl-coenzyme A thioesterase PaaI-like protein
MTMQVTREDLDPAEVEAERALFEPLTAAVRELVDATIRTLVEREEILSVTEQLDGLAQRLRARELPGGFGVRFTGAGAIRNHGNAVVGLRNAFAPPLEVGTSREQGSAWSEFELGAPYEGPPGLVHGGVVSLLFDQVLGEAAIAAGVPGMTANLAVAYLRGTPLGPLRIEARVDRVEGRKVTVSGELSDGEGVTATAEGLFILPRSAAAWKS